MPHLPCLLFGMEFTMGNKGNTKSTSTAPKRGTPADGRRSENRSKNYKGGSATKAKGSPTNPRKAGTRTRRD